MPAPGIVASSPNTGRVEKNLPVKYFFEEPASVQAGGGLLRIARPDVGQGIACVEEGGAKKKLIFLCLIQSGILGNLGNSG